VQKEENPNVGSIREEGKGGRKGVDDRGKRGDGISGEKERSVEQRGGTGEGGGRENGAGDWTDCGTWRNFAQADWTRCTTNQPGLPDSQYEVSRRISCTSAGEHTSRSVIPPSLPTCPLAHPPFPPSATFIARNLGFPPLFFRQRDHLQIGGG